MHRLAFPRKHFTSHELPHSFIHSSCKQPTMEYRYLTCISQLNWKTSATDFSTGLAPFHYFPLLANSFRPLKCPCIYPQTFKTHYLLKHILHSGKRWNFSYPTCFCSLLLARIIAAQLPDNHSLLDFTHSYIPSTSRDKGFQNFSTQAHTSHHQQLQPTVTTHQ